MDILWDHAGFNPSVLPDPTIDLHWSDFRGPIHELFAANALNHPDRECIIEACRILTYRHVNEASNQLAHFFLANGCQPGHVVAITAASPTVELVVAYMATLKAGATICALDSLQDHPPSYHQAVLDVAKPQFIVHALQPRDGAAKTATSHYASTANVKTLSIRMDDDGNLSGSSSKSSTDSLAPYSYLRKTLPEVLVGPDSISTLTFAQPPQNRQGHPPPPTVYAVQGRHFCITYYFPWIAQRFGLSGDDRFAMLSDISHNVAIQRDIFMPLYLGASLVIPPCPQLEELSLIDWMQENTISVVHMTSDILDQLTTTATTTPTVFSSSSLSSRQQPIYSLHHAFFLPDDDSPQLTKAQCKDLQVVAPNAYIVNLYGAAETQPVCYYEVPPPSHQYYPSSPPSPSSSSFNSCMPPTPPHYPLASYTTSTSRHPPRKTNNSIGGGTVANLYKPSEIPVGQGMLDVQLLVIDPSNCERICDVGQVGQIYVRSGGLAEGYLFAPSSSPETYGLQSSFLDNWFVEEDTWMARHEQVLAAAAAAAAASAMCSSSFASTRSNMSAMTTQSTFSCISSTSGGSSSNRRSMLTRRNTGLEQKPWMELYKGPRDRLFRTGHLGRYRPDGNVERMIE